jgi:RNA polymerase sigma-70 factor (ECF subfamily)
MPPNDLDAEERELRELLLNGLAGDAAAYRAFLGQLSALLRGTIHRQLKTYGKPLHDAEDIVQEALIAIHTRRHTYEPDLPVTAWTRAIARYKLIDCLRASGHDVRTIPLDDVDVAIDDTAQIEAGIAVRQGMEALPETLRVPIQAVKLDGDSPRDLARRTGTEEVTVRVNIHRGLKALARLCGVPERT